MGVVKERLELIKGIKRIMINECITIEDLKEYWFKVD
jgi:hypothetical protein